MMTRSHLLSSSPGPQDGPSIGNGIIRRLLIARNTRRRERRASGHPAEPAGGAFLRSSLGARHVSRRRWCRGVAQSSRRLERPKGAGRPQRAKPSRVRQRRAPMRMRHRRRQPNVGGQRRASAKRREVPRARTVSNLSWCERRKLHRSYIMNHVLPVMERSARGDQSMSRASRVGDEPFTEQRPRCGEECRATVARWWPACGGGPVVRARGVRLVYVVRLAKT
jgi:hypothetical protein